MLFQQTQRRELIGPQLRSELGVLLRGVNRSWKVTTEGGHDLSLMISEHTTLLLKSCPSATQTPAFSLLRQRIPLLMSGLAFQHAFPPQVA